MVGFGLINGMLLTMFGPKQVAEYGEGEVVGVIRGCVKTVTRGNSSSYAKLAYVLGLRVSPRHRFYSIPFCFICVCFLVWFHLFLNCTLHKKSIIKRDSGKKR